MLYLIIIIFKNYILFLHTTQKKFPFLSFFKTYTHNVTHHGNDHQPHLQCLELLEKKCQLLLLLGRQCCFLLLSQNLCILLSSKSKIQYNLSIHI